MGFIEPWIPNPFGDYFCGPLGCRGSGRYRVWGLPVTEKTHLFTELYIETIIRVGRVRGLRRPGQRLRGVDGSYPAGRECGDGDPGCAPRLRVFRVSGFPGLRFV